MNSLNLRNLFWIERRYLSVDLIDVAKPRTQYPFKIPNLCLVRMKRDWMKAYKARPRK